MTTTTKMTLTDRQKNEQKVAREFALALITDRVLMLAYYKALKRIGAKLAKQIKDKKGIDIAKGQAMTNWLVGTPSISNDPPRKKKSYNTNFNMVIKSQSELPMYKLFYWSGTYCTKLSPKGNPKSSSAGDPVALQTYANAPDTPELSYGETNILLPKYNKLQLSWDAEMQMSPMGAGSWVFQLSKTKGKSKRTFSGTITLNGEEKLIAGVETSLDKIPEAEKKKVSPSQTFETLKKINVVIGMLGQVSFLALNVAMIYKLNKELKEMKANKSSPEKIRSKMKFLEDAGEDTGNAISDADTESMASDVESMSDVEYSDAGNLITPEDSDFPELSDFGDIDLNSDSDSLLDDTLSDFGDEPSEYDADDEWGDEKGGEPGEEEDGFGDVFGESEGLPFEGEI